MRTKANNERFKKIVRSIYLKRIFISNNLLRAVKRKLIKREEKEEEKNFFKYYKL